MNNCAMNAFGGSSFGFAGPEKWVWHESTRTSATAQILYSQPRNVPRLIKSSAVPPKVGHAFLSRAWTLEKRRQKSWTDLAMRF